MDQMKTVPAVSAEVSRRRFVGLLTMGAVFPKAFAACCNPSPGASIDYEQIRKQMAGKKVFLVPFSHTDWAWVNSRAWMIDRHAQVLADALDFLKSNPAFRFYIETWNEQLETFLARRPDRRAELRNAIGANRIAVCGATTNQHPGWMEPESLVRDLVLGRRLFREFAPNVNLEVIVKPDVTPGSSQMPQILTKAGYRYFGFQRLDSVLTKEGLPRQFVWRGLDGSEIMTAREGGCGFIADDSLSKDFRSKWKAAVERLYEREISQHTDKYSIGAIWLPVGCDDSRPLRHWRAVEQNGKYDEFPLPLPEFIEEWNQREVEPMQFGTPNDVFRELEKSRSALPVHSGIIDPTMWTIWYGMNGNNGLRLWRARADRALVAGEKFWSCAAVVAEATYPEKEYAKLWRDLLRAYSHAQMWLFKDDYESQFQRVKTTLANASDLRDAGLTMIAERVKIEDARTTAILFNELPWDRTEVVEVWAQLQDPTATNLKVTDAAGTTVPFQVLEVNWYDLPAGPKTLREARLLVKVKVPALGYTTLFFDAAPGTLGTPELCSGETTLETTTASIHVSGNGIESVVYKPTGARFVGAGNVIFNEIKDDPSLLHFGPVTGTLKLTKGVVESLTTGNLRSSFRIRGNLGEHSVVLEADYYPESSRLAFRTVIQSRPASGHFMITVHLPGPGQLRSDVHFGVEPRDVTKVAYGGPERLRENVFWGSHWTNWSDGRGGVTVLATTGEKGFEHLPRQNRLGHYLLMTIPRDTTTWERFVTPAREGTGEHTFDYQMIFHVGDAGSANVVRRAMEAMHPIMPVYPNWVRPRAERTLPLEFSFLTVGPPNVQLSAFYRDNGKHLIRVFESAGAGGRGSIELPFKPSNAREVNFNGDPQRREVRQSGRKLEFDIKPWEIVTLEVG